MRINLKRSIFRTSFAIVIALCISASNLSSPASASATSVTVQPATSNNEFISDASHIVVSSHSEQGEVSVRLEFDAPLTDAEHERITSELTQALEVQEEEEQESNLVTQQSGYLGCGKNATFASKEGTQYLQRTCAFFGLGIVAWGFKIGPFYQAIIVGNVREHGLRWTRDGKRMPANGQHREWASYNFHGSMFPISRNRVITYQDTLSFRHNLGPRGGRGIIVFAGGVTL